MTSWADRAGKAGVTGTSEHFPEQRDSATSAFLDIAEDRATSPATFRELADAMPQIVWSCDASGKVDYLNRRWYELTGKIRRAPDKARRHRAHPANLVK